MKLPRLSKLLAYENKAVIQYYCHHHAVTSVEAKVLFADLLAWMWINIYRQQKKGSHSYLFGPLLPLDEIWHAFILHTQDYVTFCHQYFEDYFHHHIEPIGFEHQLSPEELADFLNDCFKFLGEEWVMRHFSQVL